MAKKLKLKNGKEIDVVKKANEFKAVGQSLKNKGKPTTGQHFHDAAGIIELQADRIEELENDS